MRRLAPTLILLLMSASARAQSVLYFWQPNCPPCPAQTAIVDYVNTGIQKVNAAERTDLVQKYRVSSTPWFVAIDAGGNQVAIIRGGANTDMLRAFAAKYAPTRGAQAVAASRQTTSAHCRIQVAGDGSTGSGTLVDKRDGKGLVVTCAHLFTDSKRGIRVTFADRKSYPATIVEFDKDNDLSVLSIDEPNATPAPIADSDPEGKLTAGGFGPNGVFRQVSGEVVGQATPSGARYPSTLMRGSVRSGDSGGGVFDSRGNFVGVVWGHRDGVTYACCGQPVRRLLGRIMGRRVTPVPVRPQPVYPPPQRDDGPWPPPNLQTPREDIDPGPPVEPSPGPPQPLPPLPPGTPQPTQPTNPTVDPGPGDSACNCRAELLVLNQKITELQNNVVILSERTDVLQKVDIAIQESMEVFANRVTTIDNRVTTIEGPDGTGTPPNYDTVAAEVAKRLHPLNIRINDPRGAAYSTDYKQWQIRTTDQPEQYVKLPFQPVLQPAK